MVVTAAVCAAGIPGSVEFVPGTGGLPTVLLKHACGSSAQVSQLDCAGGGLDLLHQSLKPADLLSQPTTQAQQRS